MSTAEDCDVVLDCGSGSLRAGFAGEDRPRLVMDARVGRPRPHNRLLPWQLGGGTSSACFVGDRLTELAGLLDIRSPVERGAVVRWDDAERLWSHAVEEGLRTPSERCRLLLAESPLTPSAERGRALEVLLESLSARAAFLAPHPALALYASGRTSGLVLDCGHGVAHWTPVAEGYPLPHGIARLGYAGADLDRHLAELMARGCGGFLVATANEADRRTVADIKEKLCYVAFDPAAESERSLHDPGESHRLPDGATVVLGAERHRCPEALFDPALMGVASVGVAAAGVLSVAQCRRKPVQRDMWENVVVAGGSTLFRGFRERLRAELQKEAGPEVEVKVSAPSNRRHASWVGGAIVASLSAFEPLWIRKDEYEEHGVNIIYKKCF